MVEDNKKVVGILRGTFKLIHRGHVELIEKCSTLVDELYIALDSDQRLIEAGRPIFMSEDDRSQILSRIVGVKNVATFTTEQQFIGIFETFKQHCQNGMIFYFKGGDYKPSEEDLPELKLLKKTMKRYDVTVVPVSVGLTEGYSTTQLIQNIESRQKIKESDVR